MGKRRDERRAERAVGTVDPGVWQPIPGAEASGPIPGHGPPAATGTFTAVDRERGIVTVEFDPQPAPTSVEEAVDRIAEPPPAFINDQRGDRMGRGVVRFKDSVRLWDVTYARPGQATEARCEDFEIVVDWRGRVVEVRGHGTAVFVPFENVKSIDVSEALP
jgi:hypothetical protein